MKNILDELTKTLDKHGFQFDVANRIYNPLEMFADYVSTKEIVHSKILAELLDPAGEHQLGFCFLINFIKYTGISELSLKSIPNAKNPLSDVYIDTEFYAPTAETQGRIDILVRFVFYGKRYAMIIENKLNDACDRPDQLTRYNNYVEKKLGYHDDERITVYIPRIGDKCIDYPKAVVINASNLAKIIDETLRQSISPNKAAIKAYSNYLKNISISNIIIDNAMILVDLSAADIQQAKAIKDAYDCLPQAFAKELCNKYKNEGYKTQIASNYSDYCYIWNEDSYKRTGLWLAVGFSHDTCSFYIVSSAKDADKTQTYLNRLNVAESSTSYGNIWYKPIEESRFLIEFTGKPDAMRLDHIIKFWLNALNQIGDQEL